MGKASQSKKIKRVQQAGVSRAPGQRRQLGYPLAIAGIVVLGLVLVFFAREARRDTASVAPTTEDVWFDAFGVDICGQVQPQLVDTGDGSGPFTILENGLIRVAPSAPEDTGEGATFGRFAQAVGITLGENSFTLPSGTTYTTGQPCPTVEGQPAQNGTAALFVWPPQANENSEPRKVTSGIGQVKFTEDGQIMVLAFVADGQQPPLPPTVAALSDPEADGAPATTVAGEPAPESTTTAPSSVPPSSEPAPTTEPGG
jgi:hypothetical protein